MATTSDTSKYGTNSRKPVSEVLSQKFPPFDSQAELVTPFENESKRDVEFLEKLNSMLIELIIEFHAWSSARPAHESNKMADLLEREVGGLRKIESEQGTSSSPSAINTDIPSSISLAPSSVIEKTRQRLHEFITRIKLALAALTGLTGLGS